MHTQITKPQGISPTLAINQLSQKLMQEGKEIFRFGFGQSPFPVPAHVVKALQENAFQKDYLPTAGLPLLRTKVASYYSKQTGLSYDDEQVIVGPGSKELIFLTQIAQNANLILPAPSWVSYQPQAQILNRKVNWIHTTATNAYCLQASYLDAYCQKNPNAPKLLILNYPNNPTGTSYSTEQLKEIAAVAKKHNLIVISDEIYGELNHNNTHYSLATFYPEGTIICSGLSKWCGAGGWRLGVMLLPKELATLKQRMLQIASETFSCVSAPIQHAAVQAYEYKDATESYLNYSRAILKTIATFVAQQLNAHSITTPEGDGGFYLFPDFTNFKSQLAQKNIKTSTDLCQVLLEETGVALLPGVAFGRPEEEFTARLAYVDFDGLNALEWCFYNHIEEQPQAFLETCAPNIVKGIQKLTQ